MSDLRRTAVRVRISGRVQGVWFRGWTCEQARSLGLDGWVRNRRDGTVEALFAGLTEPVATMVERCRRGPPQARVTELTRTEADDPGPIGFRQAPTE